MSQDPKTPLLQILKRCETGMVIFQKKKSSTEFNLELI